MKKFLVGLALFTFVTLGAITIFGDNLKALFGMSADCLAGEVSVNGRPLVAHAGLEKKGMRNFAESDAYAAPQAAPLPSGNTHVALPPNRFTDAKTDHLSTFAIDVDTASYTLARRTLNEGSLPVPAGVRVEEWVNAFKYDLPAPRELPFGVSVEGAPSPYQQGRTLLKVALQGRKVLDAERLPTHLVFLVDVSGSMGQPDRLPLAKASLRTLVEHLNPQDTVAIATYAGETRQVLEPTKASARQDILSAIDGLRTGGGTAMGSGMELAYRMAVRQVAARTNTRVLVLTDGDANIGPHVAADGMLKAIKGYVQEGVMLTTVGFGMGNYRDSLLEKLADSGNGQALYIDSQAEAERVFGRDVTSTLQFIARDVKVQVDFDPAAVASYRLVGYENRDVRDEDFRNDAVDGGELGAGHSVTALYEVELKGEAARLGTVHVRGQHVDGRGAFEVAEPITRAHLAASLAAASTELRFAAAVALAADHLRGNSSAVDWPLSRIVDLAREATRNLPERQEFVRLMQAAVDFQRDGRAVAQRPSPDQGY